MQNTEGRGDDSEAATTTDTLDYSKQLMQPEWMIDVPSNLHDDWSDYLPNAARLASALMQ